VSLKTAIYSTIYYTNSIRTSFVIQVLLAQYLALCDVTFMAAISACSWHVTVAVGTLVFGPIAVMMFALIEMHPHIQANDHLYQVREVPSFRAMLRKLYKTPGFLPRVAVVRAFQTDRSAKGDWCYDDHKIHRWNWLITSYAGGMWMFALWVLFKRIWMSATVHMTDGPLNAAMSLGFMICDTGIIVFLRPYNDFKTEIIQALAALTNCFGTL
jgi:hypothetical protein